jgi:predicted amidophosphoribosyltransferase
LASGVLNYVGCQISRIIAKISSKILVMNADNIFEITALGNHRGNIRSIERGFRTLTRPANVHWENDYLNPILSLKIINGIYSNISMNCDVISPVPSHDNSSGPAQLFANVLSRVWNIPRIDLLSRKIKQKSAHDSIERPNVKDHKRTIGVNIHLDLLKKKVLLVDNAIGTGFTIAAALELLSNNGYHVVNICCISIDEQLFMPDLIKSIIKPKVLRIRYIYVEDEIPLQE